MANENKLHGADAKNAWNSISSTSQSEILRELGFVPPGGTPPSDNVSSSTGGGTSAGSTGKGGTTVTTHTPNSRSNALTASTNDAINTATKMYSNLYNAIMNNDPTKTDWGKTLLNYYGIQSLADANGVRGSGAANNAGNVDSYAAANAARQRLSTLNQGVNAVMGESQNRYAAALETLKSLGVDTTGILGIEGSNVENSYGYGASLYDSNKTLEGKKYEADTNMTIATLPYKYPTTTTEYNVTISENDIGDFAEAIGLDPKETVEDDFVAAIVETLKPYANEAILKVWAKKYYNEKN